MSVCASGDAGWGLGVAIWVGWRKEDEDIVANFSRKNNKFGNNDMNTAGTQQVGESFVNTLI